MTTSVYRDTTLAKKIYEKNRELERYTGGGYSTYSSTRRRQLHRDIEKLAESFPDMPENGSAPEGIPAEEWETCRKTVHKHVVSPIYDYAPIRTCSVTEVKDAITVEVEAPVQEFVERQVTMPGSPAASVGLGTISMVAGSVSFFTFALTTAYVTAILGMIIAMVSGVAAVRAGRSSVKTVTEPLNTSGVITRSGGSSRHELPVHDKTGITAPQRLQDITAVLIEKISSNAAYTSTKFDSERIKLHLPEEMRQIVAACTALSRMDANLRNVEVVGWEKMSPSVVDKITEQQKLYDLAVNSLIDRVAALKVYHVRLLKVEELIKCLERELDIANRLIASDTEFSDALAVIVGNEMARDHTAKCAVDVEGYREQIEAELKFIRAHIIGTHIAEIEGV